MLRSFIYILPSWIVIILLRINSLPFVGDDAYMTFRVVNNLIKGNGFVYNQGEYIYVTTTVLWTSILALLSLVSGLMPDQVFRDFNLILDLANAVLIFIISLNLSKNKFFAGTSAFLYAVNWFCNISSSIGMESSFVIFLICLTAIACNKKNLWILGSVTSIACLATRPEGMFLAASFFCVSWIREKSFPLKELILMTGLSLVFFGFTYTYFGTIIPNAGIAKNLAYHREPFQSFFSLTDHLTSTVFSAILNFETKNYLFSGLIVFGLWITGGLLKAKTDSSAFLLLIFNLLVLILYLFANPLMFEWYVAPLTVSYVVLIPVGISFAINEIVRSFNEFIPKSEKTATVLTHLILVYIGTCGVLRYALEPFSFQLVENSGGYRHWPLLDGKTKITSPNLMPTLGPTERENLYIQLAKKIEPEVTSDTLVMAPEFGAFGYFSKAKIISSIGHNNPEMFQFLPVAKEVVGKHINNAISIDMVRYFKPNYIFSLETFIRNTLLQSDEFKKSYKIISIQRSAVFGSKGIIMFKKIDPSEVQ